MSVALERGTSAAGRRISAGRLAERLGISEGQVYTIAIGLLVGVVTAAIGIPPTLRDHPSRVAGGGRPPASSPAPSGGSSGVTGAPTAGNVAAPAAGSYDLPVTSSS